MRFYKGSILLVSISSRILFSYMTKQISREVRKSNGHPSIASPRHCKPTNFVCSLRNSFFKGRLMLS